MAVVHSQGWIMDWGVVVYDGDPQMSDWAPVRAVAALLGIKLTLYRSQLQPGFHPKQTHQHHFRRMVEDHHLGVWLLDEDMSLARTNLTNYLATHSCAFEGGRPVVAGVAIRQSTQHFWPSNWISWTPGAAYGWLGGALALRVSYVEGQAPLLDAKFFVWFFDKLEKETPAHNSPLGRQAPFWDVLDALGTDWGVDELWCGAAAEWGQAADGDAARAARPPCIMIREPIDHENTESIRKKVGADIGGGYSDEFEARGARAQYLSQAYFPQWFSSSSLYREPHENPAANITEWCKSGAILPELQHVLDNRNDGSLVARSLPDDCVTCVAALPSGAPKVDTGPLRVNLNDVPSPIEVENKNGRYMEGIGMCERPKGRLDDPPYLQPACPDCDQDATQLCLSHSQNRQWQPCGATDNWCNVFGVTGLRLGSHVPLPLAVDDIGGNRTNLCEIVAPILPLEARLAAADEFCVDPLDASRSLLCLASVVCKQTSSCDGSCHKTPCHTATPTDAYPQTCWSHVDYAMSHADFSRGLHPFGDVSITATSSAAAYQQALTEQPYESWGLDFGCLRPCEATEKETLATDHSDWLAIETRPRATPMLGAFNQEQRESGLLGAVVASSAEKTRDRLLKNMAVVRSQGWKMDWAAVVYSGEGDLREWAGVRAAAAMLNVSLTLHRATLSDEFHPKQAHQHHFRRMLQPHHRAVWLLDEDMSLARTNLTNFIVTHSCAFAGGAPLVAAPVVRQSTQHFWPHNWISWTPGTDYGWLGGAIALRTSFVEGQAPLLDAGFFSWFFDKLEDTAAECSPLGKAGPFWDVLDHFKTDWGTDELWCGAAAEYAAEAGDGERPACAVVREPIDHENDQSIRETDERTRADYGGYSESFNDRGFRAVEYAKKCFPKWYGSSGVYREPHENPAGEIAQWCFTGEILPELEHVLANLNNASVVARGLPPDCAACAAAGQGTLEYPKSRIGSRATRLATGRRPWSMDGSVASMLKNSTSLRARRALAGSRSSAHSVSLLSEGRDAALTSGSQLARGACRRAPTYVEKVKELVRPCASRSTCGAANVTELCLSHSFNRQWRQCGTADLWCGVWGIPHLRLGSALPSPISAGAVLGAHTEHACSVIEPLLTPEAKLDIAEATCDDPLDLPKSMLCLSATSCTTVRSKDTCSCHDTPCHTATPNDLYPETCWDHVERARARHPELTKVLFTEGVSLAAGADSGGGDVGDFQQILGELPPDQWGTDFGCLRRCEDDEADTLPSDWLGIETRPRSKPLLGDLARGPRRATGILAAVVTGGKKGAKARLVRNMATWRGQGWHVDWVVEVTDGEADMSKWDGVKAVAAMLNVTLTIHRSTLSDGFHTSLSYQHSFRSALKPEHRAIWLLGEEVSFARTNTSNWLSLWQCAFEGGAPPVVASPVVRQSSRSFWPSNWISWTPGAEYGWVGGALGLRSSYVEGYAPLIDAAFFKWFVDELEKTPNTMAARSTLIGEASAAPLPPNTTPFWEMVDNLGSDAATDELWCGAAAAYAASQGSTAGRVPCAYLREPIDHEGADAPSSVIDDEGALARRQRERAAEASELAALSFPRWYSASEAYLEPFRHAGDNVTSACSTGPLAAALTFTLANLNNASHVARILPAGCAACVMGDVPLPEQISAREMSTAVEEATAHQMVIKDGHFEVGGAAMSALQVGEGAPVPFSSTPRGRLRAGGRFHRLDQAEVADLRKPVAQCARDVKAHGTGAALKPPCGDCDAGPTKVEELCLSHRFSRQWRDCGPHDLWCGEYGQPVTKGKGLGNALAGTGGLPALSEFSYPDGSGCKAPAQAAVTEKCSAGVNDKFAESLLCIAALACGVKFEVPGGMPKNATKEVAKRERSESRKHVNVLRLEAGNNLTLSDVAHGAQLPKGYVTRKSTPPFRSFVRTAERTTVMDEVRSVDASREASATSREASR